MYEIRNAAADDVCSLFCSVFVFIASHLVLALAFEWGTNTPHCNMSARLPQRYGPLRVSRVLHLNCTISSLPSNDLSVWRIKMSSSRRQHEPQRHWLLLSDDAPESINDETWAVFPHSRPYTHIYSITRRFRSWCAWTIQVLCGRHIFATQAHRDNRLRVYTFHSLPSSSHAVMMNLCLSVCASCIYYQFDVCTIFVYLFIYNKLWVVSKDCSAHSAQVFVGLLYVRITSCWCSYFLYVMDIYFVSGWVMPCTRLTADEFLEVSCGFRRRLKHIYIYIYCLIMVWKIP